MVIGLDIDNVLINYTKALSIVIFGEPKEETASWGFEDWGFDHSKFELYQRELLFNNEHIFEPYKDTCSALSELASRHEIHLITHRATLPFYRDRDNAKAMESTIRTLRRLNFTFDGLHFTQNKHSVRCDLYVDDSPKVIDEFLERNLDYYIYSHKYNKSSIGKRINSLKELTILI